MASTIIDITAKYLGIPLSKVEKEHQRSIIRAELIPTAENEIPKRVTANGHINMKSNKTSVCSIH